MKTIDLGDIRATGVRVYSGQPRGKDARKRFHLDVLDNAEEVVTVTIPNDTYSVGPSFLLGMFGESIKRLGKERFFSKYKFPWESILLDSLNETVNRAEKTSSVLRIGA